MEPTEQLAVIVPILTGVVGRIEPVQLANQTPCAALTVQGVLDHMIGGARAFAPAFRGEQPPDPALAHADRAAHPVSEFRQAMVELLDAVNAPGALDRTVAAPFGEVPGSVFARFVAFDGLIHGWDLASATGQAYDPPLEVVEAVDEFAREAVTPEMRDGDTFALETEAPAGAGVLERLVAFSGRSV